MKKLIFLTFVILISFFACSQAPRISPEWKPFWELSQIENQTDIQSQDFPDSVTFTFLWEYPETLQLNDIDLVEEVIGKTYHIEDAELTRFGLEAGASVLFLVDESGSMRRYYKEMDSLMMSLMREIPADSFSIARFGANYVAMEEFYNRIDVMEELTNFQVRSDPDGTNLLPALYKAADMIKKHETNQKAIVLITDDSFSDEKNYVKITSVIDYLNQNGINIIVLSTGQFEHRLLSNLAFATNGVYVHDVFKKWQRDYLLSLIMHSYSLKYEPEREKLDGQVHQVVLHFNDYPVKRYGKYRVSGEMLPEYIAESIDSMNKLREQEEALRQEREKQFEYPKILLLGLRVPFSDIGNKKLSSTAEDVLDSLIMIVNGLPDEYANGKFEIKGYTCDIGDSVFNFALSQRRARVVQDYLNDGIQKDDFRYISEGYGELNPIRENDCENSRKLNRRVEIEFIKTRETVKKPDTLKLN